MSIAAQNQATHRRRRRFGLALTAAVASTALVAVAVKAAPVGGADTEHRPGQTSELSLPAAHVLKILNAGGRVIVHGWDRDEILLTITKEVVTRGGSPGWLAIGTRAPVVDEWTQNAVDSIEPAVRHGDDAVEVSTLERGPSEDVVVMYHYAVRMPRGSTLAVNSGSGPVSVSGVEGGVEIVSGNGDVECDAVAGEVVARSGNGAMKFVRVAGPLDAQTANGAILVDNRGVEALYPMACRTDNGPIRLRAPRDRAYAVEATTLNGRVAAHVSDATAPEAMLHTLNGSIHVDGI